MTRKPAHRSNLQRSDPQSEPPYPRRSPEKPPVDDQSGGVAEKTPEEVIRELISGQRREDAPVSPANSARKPPDPGRADPAITAEQTKVTAPAPSVAAEPRAAPGDGAAPKARRRLSLPRLKLPRRTKTRRSNHQRPPRSRPLVPARMRGYRPRRKHLVWAVLALVMLWRPLLLPGIAFVTFWILLIVYFTLGPDRVAELASAMWHGLQARRPETAERLRVRAAAWSAKFNAASDRLPGSWAERLHLPDFSQDQADSDARDPFERLAAEVRKDQATPTRNE